MSHSLRTAGTLTIALALAAGCAKDSNSTAAPRGAQPTTTRAFRSGTVTAQALLEQARPSLVVVRFTFDSEMGRRDLEGVGTVVRDDGLVAFSMGLVPQALPDAQMINFKIVIPPNVNGNLEETELDAEFLGRDERAELAYVRVKDPKGHTWHALQPAAKPLQIGETLYSVGLLPKGSGFSPYIRESQVSANLRGPVPLTLTSGDLTAVGSPVFDKAGNFVAFVPDQERQTAFLNTGNEALQLALPPLYVVTITDFLPSLNDPPTSPNSRKLPWLGVVQMTGVPKEVAERYGLGTTPAIQIGDVVPTGPAEAAGLHGGEIITAVNGQPLVRGDEPDELPAILSRQLLRMDVGDEVTLSIIREPGKPAEDVKVKLTERPAASNTAARYYNEELGFTVRDMVFSDRYQRHLDPSFKGATVAFVKEQGNAAAGDLKVGDVITKINQTDVTGIDQFKEALESFRKNSPHDAVVLEVLRGVNTQIIRIQPPQ